MPRQGVAITWAVLGAISGLGMALAAWLLIAPTAGPPPAFPFQDKVFHAVAFACLTGPAVLVLPPRYLWFWLAHMVALEPASLSRYCPRVFRRPTTHGGV